MKLPGTRMLELARLIIDPAAITRVLEPLVADWQREWLTADSSGRRALVRIRGLAAFLTTSLYYVVTEPMPPAIRGTAWTTLTVFGATGALILTVPFVLDSVSLPSLPLLLPSSLTLSLPFAALPLAMRLGSIRRHNPAGGRHLVRLTAAVIVLVFVMHNWVTPYANQAFRERTGAAHAAEWGRTRPGPVLRGLRELTFTELIRIDRVQRRLQASPRQISEERHNRAALPLMPIALAMLGWNLRRTNGPAGRLRIVFWWMFIASTFGAARSLGMTLERSWHLPREIAIWLPLALWMLSSAVLQSARVRHLDDKSQPVQ